MIYNKKSPVEVPIKCCEIKAVLPKTVMQNIAVPDGQRQQIQYVKTQNQVQSRRPKKKRLRIAFFAMLCAATLLFGRETVVETAKKLVYTEKINADFPVSHKTLYSRLYTSDTSVPSAQQSKAEQKQTESQPSLQINQATIAVSEIKSPVSIDGKTFYPIISRDLSAPTPYTLSNATSFEPDVMSLSKQTMSHEQSINFDEPVVLILHTHGTESYTEYYDMYPEDDSTRSTDVNKNVVRVGEEIAKTLSDFGIGNVHCTIMHDEKSFINAYNESAKTVKKYLAEYPSIKYVIDVHRDAIIDDEGTATKVVENIAGQDFAQLMFVVGTNERGHKHPNWQKNLSLALSLQQSLEDTYPGLCRSINLRDVPFNQQLSDGYLLLEVGTCSNTLEEALSSARAFGVNLARVLQ